LKKSEALIQSYAEDAIVGGGKQFRLPMTGRQMMPEEKQEATMKKELAA
jgi:hypothetical protein